MAAYAALLSLARTTDLSTTENESIFSSNAVEQVRSIHDYVNFLLSFFEEYPYKVNRWEGRIRDVAYDTEDIIEVFVWQKIQSCSNAAKANPSHVRLEVHLKDIIQKVGSIAGEVMEERPAYRPPSSSSSSSSRLAAAVNEAVIGLDDDIKAIEERLCGMSSQLQVIPIVGMGGIGKSTLARTLYDNQYMTERFDIRAWVVVSQDYNPHRFRKILLDSMRLLGKEQTSGDEIDESEMALKVYRNLKWRRYLIVVDDVWSTYVWDDMRKIFPDDNNGSQIILTTRQLDVATYSAGPVHELTFMNDSQSWDLLKQKVFGSGDCPSELEEVGKEIAQRCEGLPLAVVLVAGVLSPVNKTRASWEEIAKRMNPVVGREIEEILSLSYTYLPHHLRACFLFIGYFLEDVNIHTSRLVRLWVAEGLVKHQSRSSKSLEEDAEEYMEDLVKRNLVIVTSRKSDGKIKTCKLHDMVRGLCMKKAHEEKFLHVRDGRDIPLMNKRRISFSHSDKNTVWGATSLTILGFQVENIPSLLGSYKLLRVLDALGLDLEELPSEAFELYHLRYLAVMGSFSIPSIVCNLVNLQTLIIHLASGKIRGRYDDLMPQFLPLEIWRMPQLRHLFFHAPRMLPVPLFDISHLPLENLRTLFLVKDLVWDEEILKMIPNVKRLGIYYTTCRNYHLHHLKDLHKLEKLEVSGYMGFSWRGQSPSFPCTLKKLTLVGGGFPWRDMAVVGLLSCLKVLKLLNYACDGGTWETGDEEFPLLNVLHIEESYLQIWTTQSNPFPTLKHLVLRSCQLLTEIPEEIGEISTLELIEVDNCTNCLVESAKRIKADQESFGNDALQLRASHEVQLFFKGMALSTESEAQPKGTRWKTGLIAGQGNGGIFSVADYAALLSLAQATNLSGTRDNSLFSSDAEEKIRLIHNYVNSLLFYPEKVIPWAGRIRDLAYETEDIIDVFVWQQMQSRYRVMIPSSVKLEEQLIDVTQEIGLIAGEVVEEQPAFLLPPSSSSWFGTASNDAVVGLDEDIVAIENRLCEELFNLQVIPIVGMGGIGKSTLARAVYEDQSIIETFHIRAWVVVSQDYSQHKFWETLLGSINSFERERMSRYKTHTSDNANRLHQILMGHRYLVVMDDVWNTKVFDDVMHMFPDENNGSRIVLTTRQLDVASYTDSAGPVHQMQLMKDSQSFDLLKQKVFCPIRLEDVGWEIAHRCAGLPLAVVLVAGVISAVDPSRDSWEEVAGNMAYDVERASEEILSMSYMRLPHHLRPCFLYMGGFPKDEGHIHAPTLIKLWVAEGFLRLENGCRKSLEEEGEEYLEGLVNRNLVMVNSRKIDGKIKSCSLHDLVRDFCISKAGQFFMFWMDVIAHIELRGDASV